MTPTRLTPILQTLLDREISGGERVIWTGQPLHSRPAAGGPAVVGGILASFAVAMVAGTLIAAKAKVVPPLLLLGGLLGLVALILIVAAVSLRRHAASTVYAITDRRAIVIEPAQFGTPATTRSFAPSALGEISRREHADGSGDLAFKTQWAGPHERSAGFLALADVKRVEDLLRATLLR